METANRTRKNTTVLFPKEVFSIIIEINLIQTSFVDVIFRQRNTFLFRKLRIHHVLSTPFLTTFLQSSHSCLKLSTRKLQIYSTTTANVIADQYQPVHWTASVKLGVYLYVQHPITALFIIELLKESSKHGKVTIQSCSDTVITWMALSYQNIWGT